MQISLYYCINQGRIYVLVLTYCFFLTTVLLHVLKIVITVYAFILLYIFFIVLLKCNKKL